MQKRKKKAILASLYGRNQKAGFHIHFSTFRTYIVFFILMNFHRSTSNISE